VEFASRYDDSCRNCRNNDLSTLTKDKEENIVDDYSATEHKINEECRKNMNTAASKRSLCFKTTYLKTNAVDTKTQQRLDTMHIINDDTDITAEQLCRKVG
jgi:hypothetical protein